MCDSVINISQTPKEIISCVIITVCGKSVFVDFTVRPDL